MKILIFKKDKDCQTGCEKTANCMLLVIYFDYKDAKTQNEKDVKNLCPIKIIQRKLVLLVQKYQTEQTSRTEAGQEIKGDKR